MFCDSGKGCEVNELLESLGLQKEILCESKCGHYRKSVQRNEIKQPFDRKHASQTWGLARMEMKMRPRRQEVFCWILDIIGKKKN